MTPPHGFSWIDKPLLAASAQPEAAEELAWLRQQGIEVLISLTEQPPRRDWINDAGLFLVHVPVEDLTAPTQEQLDECVATIERAHQQQRGVAIHCMAGLGRTGTVVACYFVGKGMPASEAIERTRQLRPGSVETQAQIDAIKDFARRVRPGE